MKLKRQEEVFLYVVDGHEVVFLLSLLIAICEFVKGKSSKSFRVHPLLLKS